MTQKIVKQVAMTASRARLIAARRQRGREIALAGGVREYRYGWLVDSQSGGEAHYVSFEHLDEQMALYRCDCEDWQKRCMDLLINCKHGEAVEHRLHLIRTGRWCPFHNHSLDGEQRASAAFTAHRWGVERWNDCLACTLEDVERMLLLDPSMMTLESEVA